MITTLALFALFTIGSAVDTACSAAGHICTTNDGLYVGVCYKPDSGGPATCEVTCSTLEDHCSGPTHLGKCTLVGTDKKCKSVVRPCTKVGNDFFCRDKANYVGKCANGNSGATCTVDNSLCAATGTVKDTVCGAGSFKGKCLAKDKKCKYSEFVKVAYTVEAPPDLGSAIVDRLAQDKYQEGVASKLATYAETGEAQCDMKTAPTSGLGKIVCSGKIGEACILTCNDSPTKLPKNFTYMCKATATGAKFVGDFGTCEKSCKPDKGDYMPGTGQFKIKAAADLNPSSGTIVCDSGFPGADCGLVCTTTGHRVKTQTTLKCDSNHEFPALTAAQKGECAISVDVHATANIVIPYDADHEKIGDLKDETFNEEFRKAVIANLPVGVLETNVIIKSISLVPNHAGRRLNEKSVQVDYTIRKGDPEGATELDLPVGRGLRGIH